MPGPNIWGQPIGVVRHVTNRYNNNVSTRDTIADLRRLAHQHSAHPSVRAATVDALDQLHPVRSWRDIATAIHNWVRENVVFIEDEALLASQFAVPEQELDKELLIVPPVLLAMPTPMGDCDDFSLLTASMCLCVGLPTYFVTVAADPYDLHNFTHIYVAVKLPDENTHVCLDTGNRFENVPAGWESSAITRKAIWAV